MLIKVDSEELDRVRVDIKGDGELLLIEIENMSQAWETLKGIWQGDDADAFYGNVSEYLTKMKNIPNYLDVVQRFVGKMNGKYTDNDEAFSRELSTEVDDYEQNSNN